MPNLYLIDRPIDFANDVFVANIAKDAEYRKKLVNAITDQFKIYWDRHSIKVLQLLMKEGLQN